ncbi:hypothetical protein [Colwellia sp. E2M01]|uniref:hypothetical protein n=1 Tax=Colwellia sp. E2M01 TaxID=2841561 RepID=UPI001C09DE70|nr:hypothetical protein [Colwellia sp. E2M01]MBU2872133.1 hypothetical protein [Colwellia sp. E2M01]
MVVGIFWYVNDTLIFKTKQINKLQQDELGLIDSTFTHIEEWETNHIYLKFAQRLQGTEYQIYPRGRVIYNSLKNQFYIYLDKTIFNKPITEKIINAFELRKHKVKWFQDPHYQTFS